MIYVVALGWKLFIYEMKGSFVWGWKELWTIKLPHGDSFKVFWTVKWPSALDPTAFEDSIYAQKHFNAIRMKQQFIINSLNCGVFESGRQIVRWRSIIRGSVCQRVFLLLQTSKCSLIWSLSFDRNKKTSNNRSRNWNVNELIKQITVHFYENWNQN